MPQALVLLLQERRKERLIDFFLLLKFFLTFLFETLPQIYMLVLSSILSFYFLIKFFDFVFLLQCQNVLKSEMTLIILDSYVISMPFMWITVTPLIDNSLFESSPVFNFFSVSCGSWFHWLITPDW